jgi:2-hydroxychromene-2-carboxylate isomerase
MRGLRDSQAVPPHIDFVFSFRSPYAWLAARSVIPKIPSDLDVRWVPFFPLPSFENFAKPPIEAKFKYQIRDVIRLAKHYGAELEFPSRDDPDWSIPHSAFAEADAAGRGAAFAVAIFDARWSRGEDVADRAVIASAAETAGLDAESIVASAVDPTKQRAVRDGVQKRFEEDGIFGVPTLLMPRGTRYWGHDRIEWAIEKGLIRADPTLAS